MSPPSVTAPAVLGTLSFVRCGSGGVAVSYISAAGWGAAKYVKEYVRPANDLIGIGGYCSLRPVLRFIPHLGWAQSCWDFFSCV